MAVRNRTSATSAASTSHAVTLPSGVAAGDRLVVGFASDSSSAVSTSSTGWSVLASVAQGANHTLTILTKLATGSDALTVAIGASQAAAYVSVCMVGDGGTPTVQTNSGATATTGPVTAIAGLTSGNYDGLVFLGLDNSAGTTHTVTPPAGYTNTTTAGTSGTAVNASWMHQAFTGVTSISPANVTWTNTEQWVTANVSIPVAAAGSTPSFAAAGAHLNGSAAGATVAVPFGVVSGDVVLVHMSKDSSAAVTPPAGFTEITPAPTTTGTVMAHHVFWKRASAADSGTYSFAWTGSAFCSALATRWVDCASSGNPYDSGAGAPNGAARSSSGTVTPAVSLTTQGANRLLVWSGANFGEGAWTLPTGFTTTETDAASELSATAYKVQAAAGATGSITGTCATSERETAWLLALISELSPAPPAVRAGFHIGALLDM